MYMETETVSLQNVIHLFYPGNEQCPQKILPIQELVNEVIYFIYIFLDLNIVMQYGPV